MKPIVVPHGLATRGAMILLSSERPTRCRRPRPGNDLTARYDAVAARWHRTMQRLGYPHAYARLLDELRRRGVLHRRPPWPRVLDCGLGTGVLAAAFARAVPGVTTVGGVDLSLAMLHHAAANLAAAGVTAELHGLTLDARAVAEPGVRRPEGKRPAPRGGLLGRHG